MGHWDEQGAVQNVWAGSSDKCTSGQKMRVVGDQVPSLIFKREGEVVSSTGNPPSGAKGTGGCDLDLMRWTPLSSTWTLDMTNWR